jgi:hypothetical protein
MALSLLALPLIGKAKEQAKVMSAFFRVNFIGKFLIFNLIMRVITLPVKRFFVIEYLGHLKLNRLVLSLKQ